MADSDRGDRAATRSESGTVRLDGVMHEPVHVVTPSCTGERTHGGLSLSPITDTDLGRLSEERVRELLHHG